VAGGGWPIGCSRDDRRGHLGHPGDAGDIADGGRGGGGRDLGQPLQTGGGGGDLAVETGQVLPDCCHAGADAVFQGDADADEIDVFHHAFLIAVARACAMV